MATDHEGTGEAPDVGPHRVDFFAADRPVSGTVFERPDDDDRAGDDGV